MTSSLKYGMMNMLGSLWAVLYLWRSDILLRGLPLKGFPSVTTPSCGMVRNDIKEMTLDCLFFLRTSFSVKGHFCSFLLSNIIGYLAFLNLDICLFWFCFSVPFSDLKEFDLPDIIYWYRPQILWCRSAVWFWIFGLLSRFWFPMLKESFSDP